MTFGYATDLDEVKSNLLDFVTHLGDVEVRVWWDACGNKLLEENVDIFGWF